MSRSNYTRIISLGLLFVSLVGCRAGRNSYSPQTKYAPAVLQKDYSIYEQLLEEAHPGLYWYTSRDSMNYYFDWGKKQLNDSLSEPEFRKILAYVTSKVRCGHTSVRASRNFTNYQDTARISRIFPLSLKLWQDTTVVSANLNRRDSILKRGTIITGINGRPMSAIVDTLFKFIVTDGFNTTHKYQALSNRGYFGALYSSVFGYSSTYAIQFIDSLGSSRNTVIKLFFPAPDTLTRSLLNPVTRPPQPSRKDRKNLDRDGVRLLKIDSSTHIAMMDLSSFARGYGLRKFFYRSFRQLRKNKITHLIIDVRGNGGGSVTNSTMITRFLADKPFKVGDSLYAIRKHKTYQRYVKSDFFNRLFVSFFTHKKQDGNYHFGYFERHYFKPKRKNHYSGKTYILSGGNSFSATTLFIDALIKQEKVTVVGEETGGGAYGNTAWLIPDVTLPGTKIRFRLPLFRLVIDNKIPKDGKGVQPEIFARPTVNAIRRGADYKIEKVMELIKQDKGKNVGPAGEKF